MTYLGSVGRTLFIVGTLVLGFAAGLTLPMASGGAVLVLGVSLLLAGTVASGVARRAQRYERRLHERLLRLAERA